MRLYAILYLPTSEYVYTFGGNSTAWLFTTYERAEQYLSQVVNYIHMRKRKVYINSYPTHDNVCDPCLLDIVDIDIKPFEYPDYSAIIY